MNLRIGKIGKTRVQLVKKSTKKGPRPVIKLAKRAPKPAPKPAATKAARKHAGLLAGVGGALGSIFGPSGSVIGSAAGDLLGNLFGWGDYDMVPPVNYPIVNNSLVGMQTPLAAQIPMMHGEDGTCRIRKREYVKDINMTAAFAIDVYGLNPTDTKTFPWLNKIARQFEQYKFLGLSFGFRSLTATALGSVGNPSMGSVTVLTQYDVLDLAVTSKTQANNSLYATSCKPSDSMLHPVECDPEQTPNLPLYTGANEYQNLTGYTAAAARDLRMNYLGFTTVVTQGGAVTGPTGYNAGELWVTYDIMLYKPMLNTGGGLPPPDTEPDTGYSRIMRQSASEQIDEKDTDIDIVSLKIAEPPVYAKNGLRVTIPGSR